jgi:hypothetical protein
VAKSVGAAVKGTKKGKNLNFYGVMLRSWPIDILPNVNIVVAL